MNKKLISKCCGSEVKVGGEGTTHYYYCVKCNKACDTIPQSIQKQEEGKYRKKPVVVNVFPVDKALQCAKSCWEGLPDWLIKEYGKGNVIFANNLISLNTLEGIMKAQSGDLIIQGVNGEIYPCKPDIFEKTYEKVEDTPTPSDTFIEERLKELTPIIADTINEILEYRGILDCGKNFSEDVEKRIIPFLKSSLQEADQKWRDKLLSLKEDWKPTEGYGSEEELGFQKGIVAQIGIVNKKIEQLLKNK